MASTILEQILENVENGSTLPASTPAAVSREAMIASALGELDGALERLVGSASDLVRRFPDRSARDLVRQLSLAMREGLFDEHPTEMVPRPRTNRATGRLAPPHEASASSTPVGAPPEAVESSAADANAAPADPSEPATETLRMERPPLERPALEDSPAEPSPNEVEEALDRIFGVDADAGRVSPTAVDVGPTEATSSEPEAAVTLEALSAEALALAQRSRDLGESDAASEDSAKLDQILEALASLKSSARPSATGIDPEIVMQQIRELSLKLDRVSVDPSRDRDASGATSSAPATPAPRVAIGDIEGLVDFLNSK